MVQGTLPRGGGLWMRKAYSSVFDALQVEKVTLSLMQHVPMFEMFWAYFDGV